MSQEDFNVLFHLPYNKDQVNPEDLNWINGFESILTVSLKQIIKENIKIENPLDKNGADKNKLDGNRIILQFLFNKDYNIEDCFQSIGSNTDQLLIQLLCKPNINTDQIPQYPYEKVYDLFDDSIKEEYDLDINNLKNDIWLKILDITYEIKKQLNKNIEKTELNKNIFIAETSSDQINNRENLIREFTHLDYKVVPDENLPNDVLNYSERISEYMHDALMSVHIIGNDYAPLIKNMDVSKVELQNDIFSEVVASNPEIRRYVWISPNLKPKSEKQKQYIESFKRNIELLVNTEIIQTPLEVFKSILKENLNISDKTVIESNKEDTSKSAYIIYTEDASKRAEEIKHELTNQNINVLNTSSKGNKINMIQEHKRNLVNSDLLIILYSSENEQWLNSKLRDIIKSPGFGKKNAYDLKLLLVDTNKAPNNILTTKNLEIIDSNHKKISELISSRIEKIK